MDLTVASFDDPSRFRPKHHFGAESMHRAWLNTDGLRKSAPRAPEAGRQMGAATGNFRGESWSFAIADIRRALYA